MQPALENSYAKPIVALLVNDKSLLDPVIKDLQAHFGKCDFKGEWHEFTHSSYYEAEMGPKLWRCMLSFEKLFHGWEAAEFKKWTAAIEQKFSDEHGHRTANLDPGYVDHLKVVLVTGKHGGHKISVAPGVWIDMLLWYNKEWIAFPWAFPDFRDGTYFGDFMEIRKKFKLSF